MKKIFLLVASGLFVFIANAQKGNWFIGGNASFSTQKSKTEYSPQTTSEVSSSIWSVSPEIGTYLSDRLQLSVGLQYGRSKGKSDGTVFSKNQHYGLRSNLRNFFGKKAFRPFIGAEANFIKTEDLRIYTSPDPTSYRYALNATAGFGYALSKKWTAIASIGILGYQYDVSKSAGRKYTNHSFGFDLGTLDNRVGVGFQYNL